MPATNVSYKAKYTLCENHTTDKYCVCTKCGKTSHKVTSGCTCSKCGEEHALMVENGYCRHENYVYFGYYPQTIKSSSVSITSKTVDENGYYTGSDNKKYAKVVATPYADTYTFSTGSTITTGTAYYFKVEPIKWRILTEEDNKAFLFCESIIDAQCFNCYTSNKTMSGKTIYANNWQYSDIRTWLNNTFYKTAFDKLSQSIIQSTYLDNANSAYLYTSAKTEKYVKSQNSTYDKVFLLSGNDVFDNYCFGNSSNNATRRRSNTDYSRSLGLEQRNNYGNNSFWWTRSPSYNGGDADVGSISAAGEDVSWNACTKVYGIIPALWIQL